MIVWGGDGGAPLLNSGGRYDPATDTWTPTSTINAPSGRTSHTAVWTGTRMVVWGGTDAISFLFTGGRYDPAADTWTPTSTTGAPSARYYQSAVWTGGLMVVWGGYDGSYLDTGGRYDPASDTWTPTSTSAGPSARRSHTAVWTGAQMIVWGGAGFGGDPLNTGGRYDPSTDTWAATSMGANVPATRSFHTTVWTGLEMIVWGGIDLDDSNLNDGGRYDPLTDTWVPTSTGANVPTGRAGHTAVWTGSEMIVWGGVTREDAICDDSGCYWFAILHNSGGRYNPSSDTWTATSTGANAPDVRSDHAAIWTGGKMIVWGGYGERYLGSGGRYVVDPSIDDDGDDFSECQWDCNDSNPTVHPGAAEVCDNLDNDCDGHVDGFVSSCGVGQCARAGSCTAGVDSCVSGSPSPEVCDGIDNNCDGIMDNAPVPSGSPSVEIARLGQTTVLQWSLLPDATGYDVVRGDLGILLGTGGGFTAAIQACLADDTGQPALSLTDSPAAGSGCFYLVRGMNCAGGGTYESGDPAQVGSRDAEIDSSSLSCP